MDAGQFEALKAAFAANPANRPLLRVYLGACLEADRIDDGYAVVAARARDDFDSAEARVLAGRVCLAAGRAEEALGFAQDETPEALVLRARALVVLDRPGDGRGAYERALAANPALEDVE